MWIIFASTQTRLDKLLVMFSEFVYDSVCCRMTRRDPIIPIKDKKKKFSKFFFTRIRCEKTQITTKVGITSLNPKIDRNYFFI